MKRFQLFLLLMLLFPEFSAISNDRIKELAVVLDSLSADIPGLNEKIDVSVNGVSIQEFLMGIANNANINITVDPSIELKIINNFSKVKVTDIFLYVCKEYGVSFSVTGSIIHFFNYKEIKVNSIPEERRSKIKYDAIGNTLSVDITSDTLGYVAKEITNQSGKNIILASGLANQQVNGYIKDLPFDDAIENFAFSNNLNIEKPSENIYIVERMVQVTEKNHIKPVLKKAKKNEATPLENEADSLKSTIKTNNNDSITIDIEQYPLIDAIRKISDDVNINYFFISEIQGSKSLNISGVNYEKALEFLLSGTNYTFKKQKDVYIIGDKKIDELKTHKVIHLYYRTVEKIVENLPADFLKDIEIKEFSELNCLFVTGSQISISALESFIRQIDKVVPVILIEVMIVDYSSNFNVTKGISAGLGEGQQKTTGTLSPSIDVQLGTRTINDLMNSFNGFGVVNLGKVSPSFYLSIKALEENGVLKIRSTPKLATLNSHEATLKSGETKYYKEEQNSYYGSQIPQLAKSYSWKSINADLSIGIKPNVSGDDQVTLDIEVQQSEFTPREFEGAPPGSVTRNFKSLIRVKNQETILLGGLEKESSSTATSGLPLLSRLPVLKWIFGNVTKTNANSKLNVFVKPTIIY